MNAKKLLEKGLRETGIACTEGQIHSFMIFLSELKKWNRACNLTSLKTDEDIIVKHFLDSVLYLKAIPEDAVRLADVGAGAGFPGVPIKLVRPEMDITLIESSAKKCAFLRHIIRSLKLSGVHVLTQRVEDLGTEHVKSFDVMVSRAAFSIREFIKAACPYVKEDGILVLSKGPKVSEELDELKGPNAQNTVREILKINLPVINAERNLVVLECKKTGIC
ncbi:MAG: 16S rRNA (guanine(527)-N(7))-methyltransferase RsmG [Nitrospiraceae bacterium]|nr:MAG: 16S rRNA (guanine(527)-N(7))-methyltransferase RsmG [Nitrospiraceae bacterium]